MKTDVSHNYEEESDFIPLVNGKRKRFGLMLTTLLPGMVLLTTAINDEPAHILGLIIKVSTIIIAALVVFASIKEYRIPNSIKLMGFDTILVLTGLMVIAQGTQVFNPLKGFQPAHFYFFGGCIAIFKAVLFPEAKIKRGFTIAKHELKIKKGLFYPTKVIATSNIKEIVQNGSDLIFKRSSGDSETVSLRGYVISERLIGELMHAIQSGEETGESIR